MVLKTNSEIRKQARFALEPHWGKSALAMIIYCFAVTVIPIIIGIINQSQEVQSFSILWNFLCFPLTWGFSIFFLSIIRNEKVTFSLLFQGYKDFVRIFFTILLKIVYTFLWSLLFIIPGIVKGLSYEMTDFVLRDNPSLSYNAAIQESSRLMKGHKMKLFLLLLSFVGWFLLCILTLGFGFFFLTPYIRTSVAGFYQDLIEDNTIHITEVSNSNSL